MSSEAAGQAYRALSEAVRATDEDAAIDALRRQINIDPLVARLMREAMARSAIPGMAVVGRSLPGSSRSDAAAHAAADARQQYVAALQGMVDRAEGLKRCLQVADQLARASDRGALTDQVARQAFGAVAFALAGACATSPELRAVLKSFVEDDE